MSANLSANAKAESAHETALRKQACRVDAAALQQAVLAEAVRRARQFTSGVRAYHHHPQRPDLAPAPVLAEAGAARLLDYGALPEAADGSPVLLVPSLVNRAYILDLTTEKSLVRYLAAGGLRPLLVDWGDPGESEAGYDLAAYISGPLQHFFETARQLGPRSPILVGYCMGGLLALALAVRNPGQTRALACLATPWDFHADNRASRVHLKAMRPGIEALLDHFGHLPVDLLQAMFASLDPALTLDKFRAFGALPAGGARASMFVALEDWLNDGVPLVAGVARDCLFDWYLENAPARGNWRVGDELILPDALTCPSLTVIPTRDHIVPPASARALAAALPDNLNRQVLSGHIGMVAGSHAKSSLYEPLLDWIESLQDT